MLHEVVGWKIEMLLLLTKAVCKFPTMGLDQDVRRHVERVREEND